MPAKNEIEILVTAEVDKALKNLNKVKTNTEKTTKGLGARLAKLKAGWIALGGAIGTAVVLGFKKLVDVASDAEETFSKFDQTFKDISKEAKNVAKSFSRNFGLSEVAAKKLLSSTGDLLTGFSFTGKAALDLSKQVNELAVDLGSFQNVSSERASEALTKALLGETESAKSLGIVIRQNTKEFRDNVKEIARTRGVTLQQAKSLEILRQATEQSKNAIGDFARTQSSFANQSKILRANLENQAVALGKRLLPIATKAISVFNKLIAEEDGLDIVTRDLIKASTEYAKITKTLTNESASLTEKERAKLQVRKAELKLDIIKNLDQTNKLYKEQSDRVPRLEKQIESYNKQLLAVSNRADKYRENLEKLGNREDLGRRKRQEYDLQLRNLNRSLSSTRTISENVAESELRLATITGKSNEAIKSLSFAIKNNLISKIELSTLDKELVKEAINYSEAVDVNTESLEGNTNATDANVESKKDRASLLEFLGEDEKAQLIKLEQEKLDLIKQFSDQEVEINKAASAQRKAIRAAEFADTVAKYQKVSNEIFNLINQFTENEIERDNQKRDAKLEKLEMEKNEELRILSEKHDQGLISDEQFNEQSNAIKDKAETARADIESKARIDEAKKRRKAAQVAKVGALLDVAASTAVAIAKSYEASPLTFGLPWSGVAAGMGIAQALAIKEKPLPAIPAYQDGTNFAEGGLSLVGEQGAELVNLPRGSTVNTAGETKSILNKRSVNIENVNLPNVMNAEQFYQEMQNYQRQYGQIETGL
jgi:hypothetical protein